MASCAYISQAIPVILAQFCVPAFSYLLQLVKEGAPLDGPTATAQPSLEEFVARTLPLLDMERAAEMAQVPLAAC
jgi:hypothetical protein